MKVLLIEDDRATREFVCGGLHEAGHTVDAAADGREGLYLGSGETYDVMIIDRMLPVHDGLFILDTLRGTGNTTPALILSALGEVDHRVEGLQHGADDYLAKPFSFKELLARIEALHRRQLGRVAIESGDEAAVELTCGELKLDLLKRVAIREAEEIALLPQEYKVLRFLMEHAGQVVTRTMILEGVWGYHFDPQTNVIDAQISRLRKKIDAQFQTPMIRTVRGGGYMIAE